MNMSFGTSGGRWYVSLTRYGKAALGQPSNVTRITWFSTEARMQKFINNLLLEHDL
jgi:hypothetical protein